jgi:AcrR family transcriptional regulator
VTLEPLTPERRRAMTRRYLLDAAALVFARDGFQGATLDEVAKTAGFTKGAVYSNFKSKDDLFLALQQDWSERELAVLDQFLADNAHEPDAQLSQVRELLHSAMFSWHDTWNALYMEFVVYARHKPELLAELAAIRRRWRDFVAQLIDREYEAWGATTQYPSSHMAEISLALFAGLGYDRLVDAELVDDALLDTVLSILFQSMGIPEVHGDTAAGGNPHT